MVTAKELVLGALFLTRSAAYPEATPLNVLYCPFSVPGSYPEHPVTFNHCVPSGFLAVTVSQTSCSCWPREFWGGQVFCPSVEMCLIAHSQLGRDSWLLGERPWGAILTPSGQGHTLSIWLITGDLDHLAEVTSVKFLHCRVTPSHLTLWKEVLSTTHTLVVVSIACVGTIYKHYLEFFYKGVLPILPIYSFNQ